MNDLQYAQARVKDALAQGGGHAAEAQRLLIEWMREDDRLIRGLTAPYLKGIVGHAVNRTRQQSMASSGRNGSRGEGFVQGVAASASPASGTNPRAGGARGRGGRRRDGAAPDLSEAALDKVLALWGRTAVDSSVDTPHSGDHRTHGGQGEGSGQSKRQAQAMRALANAYRVK